MLSLFYDGRLEKKGGGKEENYNFSVTVADAFSIQCPRRLQPSEGLDEGETPICQCHPSLTALQLPCFQPAKASGQRKTDSFLAGPDLKQGCFYQVSIRHLSGEVITTVRLVVLHPGGSPKWGAHIPGIAQDKSLECRKKIFLYH